MALSRLLPECRLNPQLIHTLNQAAEIVRQHLAQGFVDLRCAGLAAKAVAKLCLDHAERRFDV